MPTLYSIKPKGDGYHILGCTLAGKFYLIRKDDITVGWKGELTFKSKEDADEFIEKHKLGEEYEAEKFWRNDKYHNEAQRVDIQKHMDNIKITSMIYCPDCGHSLRCMCTVGADESHSYFTESLYHCENCLCDYSIARDTKGNFIKMTRHFWG